MEILKQNTITKIPLKSLSDVWPGCGPLFCQLSRTVDVINYYYFNNFSH